MMLATLNTETLRLLIQQRTSKLRDCDSAVAALKESRCTAGLDAIERSRERHAAALAEYEAELERRRVAA